MSERSDEALAAYNQARQWMHFLIDHPDKSVPVDAYKAQLRDAKAAVDDAHKKLTEDA